MLKSHWWNGSDYALQNRFVVLSQTDTGKFKYGTISSSFITNNDGDFIFTTSFPPATDEARVSGSKLLIGGARHSHRSNFPSRCVCGFFQTDKRDVVWYSASCPIVLLVLSINKNTSFLVCKEKNICIVLNSSWFVAFYSRTEVLAVKFTSVPPPLINHAIMLGFCSFSCFFFGGGGERGCLKSFE